MTDLCDFSDLPKDQCDHCGARPGNRLYIEPPTQRVIGKLVTDQGVPMPRRSRRDKVPDLSKDVAGARCACGRPTRNNAYGCDHCADELSRILGDVPWLVEQLNATIAREHAKAIAAGSSSSNALMFNARAATRLKQVTNLLAGTVRTCVKLHVRHQSPTEAVPDDSDRDPIALSRWLMWRVDGLVFVEQFPDIIRAFLHTEAKVYSAIDTTASLLYLGVCTWPDKDGEPCGGAVYSLPGQAWGRCRVCRQQWNTQASRDSLADALADMLCTAAEIAHLSTYLGSSLPGREQVRKVVNQWHKRGRIQPRSHDEHGAPLFNYGEVRELLEITYQKDEEKQA